MSVFPSISAPFGPCCEVDVTPATISCGAPAPAPRASSLYTQKIRPGCIPAKILPSRNEEGDENVMTGTSRRGDDAVHRPAACQKSPVEASLFRQTDGSPRTWGCRLPLYYWFCIETQAIHLDGNRWFNRQELSAGDFVPNESLENAGILCVFQVFQTAQLGQKIR